MYSIIAQGKISVLERHKYIVRGAFKAAIAKYVTKMDAWNQIHVPKDTGYLITNGAAVLSKSQIEGFNDFVVYYGFTLPYANIVDEKIPFFKDGVAEAKNVFQHELNNELSTRSRVLVKSGILPIQMSITWSAYKKEYSF